MKLVELFFVVYVNRIKMYMFFVSVGFGDMIDRKI